MSVDISAPSNWADEVGEELDRYTPKAYTDDKGLKVFIEYKKNDEGKMVKVTRKVKMTLKKEQVNRAVAERKKWAKFGDEKGSAPGPNLQTTSVGEQIFLKLSANQSFQEEEEDDKQKTLLKGKKILCRICKGDHFTTKCPYKDTLQPIEDSTAPSDAKDDGPSTGGKYMAPHMRRAAAGGESTGESMRDKRDDSASLRVTNLSEDTRESDIHDLFRKFGHIARVFLSKDHDTGLCKGFAFVSFSLREEAERARQALDGHGYANLILRVDWSQPNNK
ncbi:translation initiation factor eIF3 subunit g [Entomophthora muscae]|uniref:Translation initiation factor eIF3 subunit g n=2 Tax=Entomophthora muscae TaxID=34485 RepID=A0ACC2TSJ8_9FUNG|nr:translation initiation factor eIF3 subunit g [Entomophthora muscae]KAJ9077725.1 translation initiation factor eIF3 subunit g [Entomophthora muscae]